MSELTKEQKVYMDDNMYIPIQYLDDIAEKPIYRGKAEHSLRELEDICKQFEEYCHQQQLIKQNIKKHLIAQKFKRY